MAYNALTVSPAYGRDYATKKAATDAWKAGNIDFRIESVTVSGRYVSGTETETLIRDGFTHVHIRYKRMTEIAVIRLTIPKGNKS